MSDLPGAIAAVGAYAPDLRIEADELAEGWGRFQGRNIEEKAVPDADEDALTMGYEAAARALSAGDVDPASVDRLVFAATTPPVAEEDLTTHLAAMLAVPDAAVGETLAGSTAAGVQALVSGLETDERTLVVASDCPQGDPDDALEHAAGAGAAAFVVDPTGSLVPTDIATASEPYPGTRFRESGAERLDSLDVTAYERQSLTAVLASAAEKLAADPGSVDAAAVHAPDGAVPYRAAGALGVDREAVAAVALVGELGDAGAAGVPLALANGIADDASSVLVAGYGSGATATLVHLERDGEETVPADLALESERYLSFAEYIRRRGDVTSGAPEGGGGYISIPTWQRSIAQRYRLEAGRCPECGALNFPPSGACSSCRGLVEYDQVELSREGTIEALSVISQGGAPPEFAELQAKYGGSYATGIVAFDGPDGASASVPAFVVGTDHDDLAVGDRVRATMRRIYTQEGVTRYGFKVQPLSGE